MSNKIIHVGTPHRQGIVDTLVTVKDLKTGEILDQGPNSILYAGSLNAAMGDFGFYNPSFFISHYGNNGAKFVDGSGIAIPPNYDLALLGESKYSDGTPNIPSSEGVVCLFAVGIDGVENTVQASHRKAVKYEGWMDPADMCAFRVINAADSESISTNDKEMYAKRLERNGSYFYYFKKFEQQPVCYTQREKSGDEIPVRTFSTAQSAIDYYNTDLISAQENSQVIIQMTCKVTPDEIREWFEWRGQANNTNISSIMICTAIPVYDDTGNIVDYKNIMPKSKRHITRELLLDADKGLEIIYQYMY